MPGCFRQEQTGSFKKGHLSSSFQKNSGICSDRVTSAIKTGLAGISPEFPEGQIAHNPHSALAVPPRRCQSTLAAPCVNSRREFNSIVLYAAGLGLHAFLYARARTVQSSDSFCCPHKNQKCQALEAGSRTRFQAPFRFHGGFFWTRRVNSLLLAFKTKSGVVNLPIKG